MIFNCMTKFNWIILVAGLYAQIIITESCKHVVDYNISFAWFSLLLFLKFLFCNEGKHP